MPKKPVTFDHDNPEWTEADFAGARPLDEYPELAAAFPKSKGGRPRGSNKVQVSLRIDRDIIAKFKAAGPGWQSRMNEALRRAQG
ncbi:BrnA antitoxin family protein [Sphingomonas flavalba]|uniref:BrnA antitoxin family protein n=1 Tax=Sphingomonas flavalba TaxID=2559804 RepID=UPI0039E0B5ED